VSREVVQLITANFDSFTEEEEPWGGQGSGVFGGCLASSPPERSEFIGYTFKRKKDVRRQSGLDGLFGEMA